MNDQELRIIQAQEMDLVRELFREYQDFLNVNLCFQGFEAELAELPGSYSRPLGDILFAVADQGVVGVVARRPLDDRACEMKRLYVRPGFRGLGAGRRLVERTLNDARVAGFKIMRLDTLPKLETAIGLYRAFGFRQVEPYYNNPLDGVTYWEKDLG